MPLKSKTDREILMEFTPVVAAVVRQVTTVAPNAFSREQLHSFGLVALLSAVRNRQHNSPPAFESFARTYIHDALLGEVRRQKNWLPGSTRESISNLACV